jgi:hypothetical protein
VTFWQLCLADFPDNVEAVPLATARGISLRGRRESPALLVAGLKQPATIAPDFFPARKIRGFFLAQFTSEIAPKAHCMLLATLENTLLALPPTKRIVPITRTRMTASITAYSAISCPSSSNESRRISNMTHPIAVLFCLTRKQSLYRRNWPCNAGFAQGRSLEFFSLRDDC